MFGKRRNSAPTQRPKHHYEFNDMNNPERSRHSDKLHNNTGGLLLAGHNIHTYAKKLNKLKTKILRKRAKSKSKQLQQCEDDYGEAYTDLVSAVKKLNELMPTMHTEQEDGGFGQAGKHDKKQHRTKTSQRVSELQRQVDLLKKQLGEETSAKDDAIRRLSELASSKLRDNNPNIADLSDNYRPTKIAEVVSELYENEWTGAFEELEKLEQYSDKEIVQHLIDTFVNIYNECRHITTTGFFEKVKACIEQSDVLNTPQKDSSVQLPDQLRQQVKEFRKFRAPHILAEVVEGILNRKSLQYLRQEPYNISAMGTYVKKCTEVSWMMCVQDPALVLSRKTNEEFNTSLFREYTKRGPYVEYVVWPILYLHEGGPVLGKGVAQGTSEVTKPETGTYNQETQF